MFGGSSAVPATMSEMCWLADFPSWSAWIDSA